MSNLKQYVIVRRDLNLTAGELSAQVAHLSMLPFVEALEDGKPVTNTQKQWLKKPYLIVLGVDNVDELNMVSDMCLNLSIPFVRWDDTVKSKTFDRWYNTSIGVTIGPEDSDVLKQVVGPLKLI